MPDSPDTGLSEIHRTLPIALLRLRERVMSEFRPILQAHNVTEQQWRVMRVLMEADSMDASELAATACILAPSLSRILKTLDARGHIAIDRDPHDARRVQIRMTDKGRTFIARVTPESAAVYDRIAERLGPELLGSLLTDLETALEKMND
ncbi:homoprotocatechuate degradation operon regulator HpaR [Chachezhania sediminis]|uniref:homoprotocatechuate degradation operon regulator HpaR n=1 Tax=Chachezhania sediminis TaxID=2599291 RepID=UPI001E4C1BF8|nr:homoprotocatechuate degradation operon regulator HpaR [Chachezhania sediminis]